MKEAIGGTWLFQIVILFIFLFTAYICLSINHSKAFAVKDDIVEIIERNNGLDMDNVKAKSDNSDNPCISQITERLKTVSYRTNGNCNNLPKVRGAKWYGFNRSGGNDDANAVYCIAKVNVNNDLSKNNKGELPEMHYYKIAVFYQLDLPVLNSVMSFKVLGDTKTLYAYK